MLCDKKKIYVELYEFHLFVVDIYIPILHRMHYILLITRSYNLMKVQSSNYYGREGHVLVPRRFSVNIFP